MLPSMAGKPGRPRSLTLEQIAQAALDDGLAAFSMPSVSRRVGVAHSALYRYVADRDELLYLALERALGTTKWPDANQPWRDLLVDIGESTWDLCERFPGFDRAAIASTRNSDLWQQHCLLYVQTLHEQGFSREDAAVVVDFVARTAISSSREMSRLTLMHQADSVPEELAPYNADEPWTGRGWYDRQLHIVLEGAATLRQQTDS